MTIFISGSISNRLDTYKQHFNNVEQSLTAQGHEVWNPAHNPKGLDYEAYFPVCFAMIDSSDAIYMLNGWETSEGARRELEYATSKNKEIIFER